jgi:uncharacterized protein (DUF2147 family)
MIKISTPLEHGAMRRLLAHRNTMRHNKNLEHRFNPIKTKPALAVAALLLSALPGLANDPTGIWLRESGASRVRLSQCGDAMCGSIIWLKDESGPAKIGQRVFYDMMPDGANKWAGKAFNPEDGKIYAGKMTLSGSSLTTAGCVLGGLICKSVNWKKVN